MTPLEHARAILDTLTLTVAPGDCPTPHVVGVGAAVIACAETRVTLASLDLSTNPGNAWACDVGQVANYVVSISRDCARTFNEDGTEDYASLDRLSEIVDGDVTILSRLFDVVSLDVPVGEALGWGLVRTGGVTIEHNGAQVVTALALTVGVP